MPPFPLAWMQSLSPSLGCLPSDGEAARFASFRVVLPCATSWASVLPGSLIHCAMLIRLEGFFFLFFFLFAPSFPIRGFRERESFYM